MTAMVGGPMNPSRRRLVGAMSMATPFCGVWMAGPALLPFSDLTWPLAAVGLAIPYSVAGLTWRVSETRARREVDTRQAHRTNAVREREVVR